MLPCQWAQVGQWQCTGLLRRATGRLPGVCGTVGHRRRDHLTIWWKPLHQKVFRAFSLERSFKSVGNREKKKKYFDSNFEEKQGMSSRASLRVLSCISRGSGVTLGQVTRETTSYSVVLQYTTLALKSFLLHRQPWVEIWYTDSFFSEGGWPGFSPWPGPGQGSHTPTEL